MSVRIVQRAQARLDFWQIVDFLATQNVSAAERFIQAVKESYEFLADWPEAGGRVDKDDPELANVRFGQSRDSATIGSSTAQPAIGSRFSILRTPRAIWMPCCEIFERA